MQRGRNGRRAESRYGEGIRNPRARQRALCIAAGPVEPDLALHPRRHFALRVDDVARMRGELEAQGVRSEEATEITGWIRCYVFDPFGNKIELDQIP